MWIEETDLKKIYKFYRILLKKGIEERREHKGEKTHLNKLGSKILLIYKIVVLKILKKIGYFYECCWLQMFISLFSKIF